MKKGIDVWTSAAGLRQGQLLPSSRKASSIGEGLCDWATRSVVEQAAKQIGIERIGAHDLRR